MAQSLTIASLQMKAQELQRQVIAYEDALEKVRHDLAIISQAIRICERGQNAPEHFAPHLSLRNFFATGEMLKLTLKALEGAPEGLSNRELEPLPLRLDHRRRSLTRRDSCDTGPG